MFFETPLPAVILYCDWNHSRAVRREYWAAEEEGSMAECCSVSS